MFALLGNRLPTPLATTCALLTTHPVSCHPVVELIQLRNGRGTADCQGGEIGVTSLLHSNQSQKCNIVIVTFHWFETLLLPVLVTSEPVAHLLLKYGRKETGS